LLVLSGGCFCLFLFLVGSFDLIWHWGDPKGLCIWSYIGTAI
jgi:hypothetical protein